MWHKVNFLAVFNRFEVSFPSPRQVKEPICLTIYPSVEVEELNAYLSK